VFNYKWGVSDDYFGFLYYEKIFFVRVSGELKAEVLAFLVVIEFINFILLRMKVGKNTGGSDDKFETVETVRRRSKSDIDTLDPVKT